MKVAKVKYNESVSLEFTDEELYIINWALSDYMLLLQYSLIYNVVASPIIKDGESFDPLDSDHKKDLERNLDIAQDMKGIMELLVY